LQVFKTRKMKNLLKGRVLLIAGVLLGAIGGFFYWKYVGCVTGTCPIQSNPYRMTAYGALMGGLLFSMFQPPAAKA
jgi:hypothetical protein